MTTESTVERRRGVERRVRRMSVHLPERRSGFDRRLPERGRLRVAYFGLLHGYRRRPRLVAAVIVGFVALGAADFALTLGALRSGAEEVNPVMAALFDAGVPVAGAFKLGLTLVVAALMWSARRYRRVLEASFLLLALMAALLVYHLVAATRLAA